MSRHLRTGLAAFLLVASLAKPAASNPFTDLFSPNPEPNAAVPAPDPAQEECLPQPGKSTTAGLRWVYRRDGHRRCWFQAEAATPSARRIVHRHTARHRATAVEANDSISRKEETIADARAEILSSVPVEANPPPSAPVLNMVDAAPIPAAQAAAPMPPADAVDKPGSDELMPDRPTSGLADAGAFLADARAASEVAAAPPATALAVPSIETDSQTGETMRWWFGVLLIALGSVAFLGASRKLRQAFWPARSFSHRDGGFAHAPSSRGVISGSVAAYPRSARRRAF
jgi:hypothetical protein